MLYLLAACAIAISSHYEHTQSTRPSLLLAFYLCLAALLRPAITRTYWSLEANRSAAGAALATLLVQLFMAELESGRSRGPENTTLSLENSASFMSRILFLSLDRSYSIDRLPAHPNRGRSKTDSPQSLYSTIRYSILTDINKAFKFFKPVLQIL